MLRLKGEERVELRMVRGGGAEEEENCASRLVGCQ